MITTNGKYHIKRYLANQVPQIGKSIAFGVGTANPAAGDVGLQLEVARSTVNSVSYNFATDKLIFKARVPDGLKAVISEVGLFSLESNTAAGRGDDMALVTFDSQTEDWGAATWESANARVGIDALRHAPAASNTSSNVLEDTLLDLSVYSNIDSFSLAFFNTNSNTSSIQVRLRTDDTNYFSYTKSDPATGYRIETFTKGSMVVTGTPDWKAINSIQVLTTAKSGGSAAVDYDALIVRDMDSNNPDYVLVAREVITPSFTTVDGAVNEVEIALGVTV